MKKLIFVLICIIVLNLSGEDFLLNNPGENQVSVLLSNSQSTIVKYEINKVSIKPVIITGEEYQILHLKSESGLHVKGEPELPVLRRGLLIDGTSNMSVNVVNLEYQEFDLLIAPAKGPVSFAEDYDLIPYTFGEVYTQDAFYPGIVAELSEPYIMRDYRGIDLQINPVQYNPVTGKVRIYTRLEVELYADGQSSINVRTESPAKIVHDFKALYQRHFINYNEFLSSMRYPEIMDVTGKLLVICYDDFMTEMEPYVTWKIQKGIETEIVAMSDIGTTNTQLENYLDTYYEEDNELAWVLFVGDAQQIPVIYNYSPYAGDAYYARVAGSDQYPDIMIGRFSAQSEADVETQVDRSIYYERDISDGDWMQKAAGVAYNGGPAGQHYEGGWQHMGYIRDDLLEYGYLQVDEIYEGQGASTQVLADAINEGRGVINYLGHGEDQNYYSIPFYQSDVYNLQNVGMLPFVCNGACLIGNFAPITCFAEFWLRATNADGEAIGAIGFLASSISQWIGDPEYGQDEFVDLLCAESKQTIGGLWYNCINYAMEITSEPDEFCSWNVFGDPNLVVRSKIPQELELSHMPTIFMGFPSFEIDAGEPDVLICLTRDGEIAASGYTGDDGIVDLDISEVPQIPGFFTITATGFNKVTLIEEIQMIPPEGAFVYLDEMEIHSGLDEVLHAGETATLDLSITNYGTDQATNVQLEMILDDEWIEVVDNMENIGDMQTQENIFIEDALCFEVSEDIEFAHPFSAELIFTSDEDSWSFELWFSSYAPNGLWMSPLEIRYEIEEGDSVFYDLVISNYLEEAVEINLRLETEQDRDVSGCFIGCNTESFLPGGAVNWNFVANNYSIDNEWISEIEIDFPDEVDVDDVTPFVGASGGNMETESELGYGADVLWLGISPNDFGFLHGGESATCQVEASIDYADLDSLLIEWRMTGDGYGADPHTVTGTIDLLNPLSWIYMEDIHDVIPAGSFSVVELEFDAQRLTPGEYFCEIVVTDDRLESRVPVLLTVVPQSAEDQDVIAENNSFCAYPNPFNPSINISYNISQTGSVELAVYNLKGQKIETLCASVQEQGNHNYIWNADEMPSGIYFLKIKGAGLDTAEKVLLLK
ncbi:MAG: T9SS type A sorting domain-containing protein [Candidatus Cloacimonetes bacterium]|nr:T9SS type A sorting domain-containing protein [Candidatus Cloacimonadota bacterium]